MRKLDFERAVAQAMDELPLPFRRALRHVRVEIADRPSRAILKEAGLRPGDELFGWYEGTPLTERTADFGMAVPDRIVIFQRPLEAAFRRRRDLIEEIKTTLRHELGHHLGLDEDELAEMGLE